MAASTSAKAPKMTSSPHISYVSLRHGHQDRRRGERVRGLVNRGRDTIEVGLGLFYAYVGQEPGNGARP